MHHTANSDFELVRNASRKQLLGYLRVFGILGSMRGLHDDADVIHAALERVVKRSRREVFLRVLAQAISGESSYAIQAMTQMLEKNPDDDLSKVVMALCMLMTDHPDGRFTLDNVIATSLDQDARAAALQVEPLVPLLLQRAKAKANSDWNRPA